MSTTELPDDEHFVRVVSWARVRKDAQNNPVGITAEAYLRREDEEGLSGNWLEEVDRTSPMDEQLRATLSMIRLNRSVGNKARLAVSRVGQLKAVCADRERKVRIVHAPDGPNTAHSEVRRLPRDDLELLERIAAHAVISHHCCGDLSD